MRRRALAGFIVFLLANFVCAQKRTTILGDAWTGEVISTSDATREITLRHPDKDRKETFIGILEEGYKVKMQDGSLRELKVSEIKPAMRIRVFYKSKQQDIGGRKLKVQSIYRVDFLGRDEYTRLREALKSEPSIPVIPAESSNLPATDPLKIFLAIEQPYVKDGLVKWVNGWNKKEAAKYGSLEIVPDSAASDISLVVFWGADETVAVLPALIYDQRDDVLRDFYQATAHIVTKETEGLKVLWQKYLMLSRRKLEGYTGLFENEIEKRMKAKFKK